MQQSIQTQSGPVPCRIKTRNLRQLRRAWPRWLAVSLATVSRVLAQDPWTASANNLKTTFTGPIATALIAVAVVITGMTFAFSEGQGKRQLTGLLFGGAMALGAVRFMAWIFT
jgi:type IV secretory pathway VirB2 component (pilin)